METTKSLLGITLALSSLTLAEPALEQAEVRIPYGELRSLIEAARPVVRKVPDASLLSARFRVSIGAGKPVLDASFRTASFSDDFQTVPLVGGNVSVASQTPEDARILIRDSVLCHALDKRDSATLDVRLLSAGEGGWTCLQVPGCPAAVFETGDLGADHSIGLRIDGRETVVGSNASVALPIAGALVDFRILGGEETREALRPPEPSTWSWQHQVLVVPGEGDLAFRVIARASASGGSGVAAALLLPADAREITVTGKDLAAQKMTREADRSQKLHVEWGTRGLLEREIGVFYQLPRRPLDRKWMLHAPAVTGGGVSEARFIVAGAADLSYEAAGLAGPFLPKGLPVEFTTDIKETPCYQLESGPSVELRVNPLPVVATAEATIGDAQWSVKLEPDGAVLIEGAMGVEYRGTPGITLDVPEGMTLLSCHANDQAVSPVDRGGGRLEVHLPAAGGKAMIKCSFTGKVAAIDPMEGTLELSLPKVPLFIRSLNWVIDLPAGYQAETHGNLVRVSADGDSASRLCLRKNLCRDEQPRTHVFYQRSNRNP